MKLAPKHFRLLSMMRERGSVPARIMPSVREELVVLGLVEYFRGGAEFIEKDRYRSTEQGRQILAAHDKRLAQGKDISRSHR